MEQFYNPHAGEIIKYEFLEPLNMSCDKLAQAINAPNNLLSNILDGTDNITADIDLKLCKYFSLSEGYFLRLQQSYITIEAKRKLGQELDRITPLNLNL